jgi:hypothetical protein
MSKGKTSKTARDPILDVFFAKRQHKLAVGLVKTERRYGAAKVLLPKLGLQQMSPDMKQVLLGIITAEKWDDVFIPPATPPSKNLFEELGWLAHGFRLEAVTINSFLGLRKAFGKCYLLGNYVEASAILEEVRKKHGLSLWLAEREFMLLQAKEGFSAHKEKLSNVQGALTSGMVSYLLTKTSHRLEPHVTYDSYQRSCQHNLKEIRSNNEPPR